MDSIIKRQLIFTHILLEESPERIQNSKKVLELSNICTQMRSSIMYLCRKYMIQNSSFLLTLSDVEDGSERT